MKPIKVLFDKVRNTLNIWFDDPQKERSSTETSNEVVLVKDAEGRVIGVEVLNFLSSDEPRDFTVLPIGSALIT